MLFKIAVLKYLGKLPGNYPPWRAFLAKIKKNTPPRIFSLEFFRNFQNSYSTFSSDSICRTENHRDGFPRQSQMQPSVVECFFKLKLKQNTPPRMFSREFSWVFQKSSSKISGWLPLGQLIIFLDVLVFHFKGLSIQNVSNLY